MSHPFLSRLTLGLCLMLTVVIATPSSAVAEASYILEVNGSIPADLEEIVASAGGTVYRVHGEIDTVVARSATPGFADQILQTGLFNSCLEDTVRPGNAPFEVMDVVEVPEPPEALQSGLTAAPEASVVPTRDPRASFFWACQWNLRRIGADVAWDQGIFGDPSLKVALLSTGIDPSHLALVGQIDLDQAATFLTPGTSPCAERFPDDETGITDYNGFGNYFSGTIAANGFGMAAVAPSTRIVPVKVRSCLNTGLISDLTAGILYAASLEDVAVIFVAFHSYLEKTPELNELIRPLRKAIGVARQSGKLVVAPAGDDASNLDTDGQMLSIPAELNPAVSVYSSRRNDELASYSNFGAGATLLGAPGGFGLIGGGNNPFPPIPGCVIPQGGQAAILGACSPASPPDVGIPALCSPRSFFVAPSTRNAAATVAGSLVLIQDAAGGSLNPNELKDIAVSSATDLGEPGVDPIFSRGEVNPGAGVTQVLAGAN